MGMEPHSTNSVRNCAPPSPCLTASPAPQAARRLRGDSVTNLNWGETPAFCPGTALDAGLISAAIGPTHGGRRALGRPDSCRGGAWRNPARAEGVTGAGRDSGFAGHTLFALPGRSAFAGDLHHAPGRVKAPSGGKLYICQRTGAHPARPRHTRGLGVRQSRRAD
jgi:hypothetical protein